MPAFAGGLLIGVAAVLLFAVNGRIAGVSGILNGALSGPAAERGWRWLFVGGLIVGALAVSLIQGGSFVPRAGFSPWLLVTGGLLVGFGTRLGSGCTSGHGVCGVARLSRRSIVATLTFMLTGFSTVYVLRHLLGVSA